jgi:hypothetical protein
VGALQREAHGADRVVGGPADDLGEVVSVEQGGNEAVPDDVTGARRQSAQPMLVRLPEVRAEGAGVVEVDVSEQALQKFLAATGAFGQPRVARPPVVGRL